MGQQVQSPSVKCQSVPLALTVDAAELQEPTVFLGSQALVCLSETTPGSVRLSSEATDGDPQPQASLTEARNEALKSVFDAWDSPVMSDDVCPDVRGIEFATISDPLSTMTKSVPPGTSGPPSVESSERSQDAQASEGHEGGNAPDSSEASASQKSDIRQELRQVVWAQWMASEADPRTVRYSMCPQARWNVALLVLNAVVALGNTPSDTRMIAHRALAIFDMVMGSGCMHSLLADVPFGSVFHGVAFTHSLAAASILIALKTQFLDFAVPRALVRVCDVYPPLSALHGQIPSAVLAEWEAFVLSATSWAVTVPTAAEFVDVLLSAAPEKEAKHDLVSPFVEHFLLATSFSERMDMVRASLVAAGAVWMTGQVLFGEHSELSRDVVNAACYDESQVAATGHWLLQELIRIDSLPGAGADELKLLKQWSFTGLPIACDAVVDDSCAGSV